MSGKIYVGRRVYNGKDFLDYVQPNTKKVLCLTKSTPYGCLGPYVLRVPPWEKYIKSCEEGTIMENTYQGSKIYPSVKPINVRNNYTRKIIFSYPNEEKHITKKGNITKKYWNWRYQVQHCEEPLRYPVGYHERHNCKACVKVVDWETKKFKVYNYVDARKYVYEQLYRDCVNYYRETNSKNKFDYLLSLVKSGQDITIVEVDGPRQEFLEHYIEKYNLPENFIQNNVVEATFSTINIFEQDTKAPCGHGFYLAKMLLEELDN